MANTLSSTLVPPSRKTVNFLYNGLVIFYPESVFGAKEGKKRAALDYWSETGYRRPDFARLLWNITRTEDTESAAKIVLGWKNTLERGIPLKETIPANLDEMLSRLEESSTEKKLSPYKAQQLAKESLLVSQKTVEESASVVTPQEEVGIPAPEIISKTASPLNVFAGKIITAPFRSAVYLSGPTVHSSKAEGEGSGVATARHILTQGITSSSILSLKTRAQEIGLTPSQLENLAKLIKQEQEAHPLSHRWFTIIYSSQKARLTQAQVASLLIPSADGNTAIFPRKSFLGGLLGRIGQQLLGKFASKGLKTVAKKVATKLATTAAAQVAATATFPVVANVVVLVGQAILGKIKDFISSLKSKEGKEKILAFVFGSMVLGGILLGGPVGAILVMGGLVPGLGFLVTKAGGFGPLGASVGSYGQAFLAGITGVILPAIGAPIIIAFISIPILIAVILFIINSGAYIVPPSPSQLPGAIESPYIGIEKIASPKKIDKIAGEKTVSYSVRIWAKKGAIIIKSISNEYKVISRDNPEPPTSPAGTFDDLINKKVSPTDRTSDGKEGILIEYNIDLGTKFNDSVVVDILTVVADAPEQKEATARESASVVIGNPPMHCPVPGGYQFDGSYTPGDETEGHGSNDYWNRMGTKCAWRIPQGVCWGPLQSTASSNYCYGKSGSCPFYGYALDIFPTGSNDVYVPTIKGKAIVWNYSHGFSNGSSGWSHVYKSGPYYLVLTHLKQNANKGSNISSGEKVGELFPLGGNTHLHLEFAINGQYQRPEEYFCF
ncbi:MAG: hypothetical protein WBE27_00865 [Microgenomates group bacterium]